MGYDVADAHDLTQAFFARVLEKDILSRADAQKGRFRTFLLTSLNRFVINEWHRERSLKRGGDLQKLPLDFSSVDDSWSLEPATDFTPQERFEREWAEQILTSAFQRLSRQHSSGTKRKLFEAIAPCIARSEGSPSYDSIAQQLDLSVAAVKMSVTRIRKKLRELIVEEIRATVAEEEDVDDELDNLFRALSL